jgi:hypothetical protein
VADNETPPRLVTVLGVWWCARHNCLTEGNPDDGMCDVVSDMDLDEMDDWALVGCDPRELCFVAQRNDTESSVPCTSTPDDPS